MTDEQLKLVQPVLDTFENKDIKEFTIALLDNIPDYIWHVGASSTGKYHPAYSLGEGGLMRHQVAVVRFLNFFFALEQYNSKLTSRERDLMRLAGLVHDARKSGSQEDYEKSKYTKFNHPILMADVVRSFDGQYLNHDEIELVANTISKHMGQWSTDKKSSVELPKPNDKYSRLVHLADYLASRKDLTMDFEGYIATPSAVTFDPEYKISFGKHTGRRLIDVYKTAPDYITWCEENIHRSDFLQMIKAMKEYLKNKENA
jgi:hypothetical protein